MLYKYLLLSYSYWKCIVLQRIFTRIAMSFGPFCSPATAPPTTSRNGKRNPAERDATRQTCHVWAIHYVRDLRLSVAPVCSVACSWLSTPTIQSLVLTNSGELSSVTMDVVRVIPFSSSVGARSIWRLRRCAYIFAGHQHGFGRHHRHGYT